MNKCSAHPGFYSTANTPCPACREQAGPTSWAKTLLEDQKVEIELRDLKISELANSLILYSVLALSGWSVVVFGGLYLVFADYARASLS